MKPIVSALVALFAFATLALTLLMPAVELIPAQVSPAIPQAGDSPVRCPKLMTGMKELAQSAMKACGIDQGMKQALSSNPDFPYYLYALFLALAMTASALAINAVGRWDSEEKTVLPLKK